MDQREEERRELIRVLSKPESIQMLAPRRIGKTWLLHRLEEDLKALGWNAIFLDAQGMTSEEEFLGDLCERLQEGGSIGERFRAHFGERFKNLVGGEWNGNLVDAIGKLNSKRFSRTLVESLSRQERETVILVDEIGVFVLTLLKRDPDSTRTFLHNLRKLCLEFPKVRWVFTGSIGLDAVARRFQLGGTLVDLAIVPLEPLSLKAAKAFLARLVREERLPQRFAIEDSAFEHLAKELGWLSPYYVEKVANEIVPSGKPDASGLKYATTHDISKAFDRLLRPHYRSYFAAWEEHLEKNFVPSDTIALQAILSFCAQNAQGETFETLQAHLGMTGTGLPTQRLTELLNNLEVDGFLILDGGRWRFVSGLLRRYWQRYHSL